MFRVIFQFRVDGRQVERHETKLGFAPVVGDRVDIFVRQRWQGVVTGREIGGGELQDAILYVDVAVA